MRVLKTHFDNTRAAQARQWVDELQVFQKKGAVLRPERWIHSFKAAAALRGLSAAIMADTTAIPSAPAAITAAALSAVIPPMPTRGRLTAALIRRIPSRPSGAAVSFLVGRGKDRADGDIIRPLSLSPNGIGQRFGRDADDEVGAGKTAGLDDVHILLPEMESVGTDYQGHIQPVIDDKGDSGRLQYGFQQTGLGNELARRAVFLPQLHAGDAAGNSRPNDIAGRPTP